MLIHLRAVGFYVKFFLRMQTQIPIFQTNLLSNYSLCDVDDALYCVEALHEGQ